MSFSWSFQTPVTLILSVLNWKSVIIALGNVRTNVGFSTNLFVFELGARTIRIDRRAHRRTGKTHNAAYKMDGRIIILQQTCISPISRTQQLTTLYFTTLHASTAVVFTSIRRMLRVWSILHVAICVQCKLGNNSKQNSKQISVYYSPIRRCQQALGLQRLKDKSACIWQTSLTATERHLPYGITQCYLRPDIGERAPPYPSQTGW